MKDQIPVSFVCSGFNFSRRREKPGEKTKIVIKSRVNKGGIQGGAESLL